MHYIQGKGKKLIDIDRSLSHIKFPILSQRNVKATGSEDNTQMSYTFIELLYSLLNSFKFYLDSRL